MTTGNKYQYPYSANLNTRTLSLVQKIRGLDGTSARYKFIDSLSASDRAELFKGLPKTDKVKYDSYRESTVNEKTKAEREQRLEEARLGNARDIKDIVQVLLEHREILSSNDRFWVQSMDETGSRQRTAYSRYSPRQQEVFWSIYRRYFPKTN